MQDGIPPPRAEYDQDIDGPPAPSIDFFAILAAVLRRWKLITATTILALVAAHVALRFVTPLYKSTVEILIYDPQKQLDATVQKQLSPFVDPVSFDAMNTEIRVLKSKSVALRVARELNLDKDPEFQLRSRWANLAKLLGSSHLGQFDDDDAQTTGGTNDEQAERLDKAADALRMRLDAWSEAYIIFVSATSQNPIKAQLLASTVAKDYLESQREARQEALQRVATWLKDRVADLQSQLWETESAIEKIKEEIRIREPESNNASERQISELNYQLMNARAEVDEERAHLDQAHHVIDTNGDIQSIPELTASTVLTGLRQTQTQLNWRAADLENKVGGRHAQVIAIREELAGINRQINTEAEHILGNMKNEYDIAVRRKQSLEENLRVLTSARALGNSETYSKLQNLQRVVYTTRILYDSYLSQYNEISQRHNLQYASARIISPATLPTSPIKSRRMMIYALGGVLGLGSSFLFVLLEYFRSGVRTGAEIENSFYRPVVGAIPSVRCRKFQGALYDLISSRTDDEESLHLFEAVCAMRINLALLSTDPKVILITSALPAEGKSTVAMLLAASSASSGRRTILLDCDLRQHSVSKAFRNDRRPGLSELLLGTVELRDVITEDPVTKVHLIPAGCTPPNAADLLMSQRMQDLVAELRRKFDYVVMDSPPLLVVVDALAVATVADKVFVVVEWSQTRRASISEAFNVLRPEAHRIAGLILNKVDFRQLQGYGYRVYNDRAVGKYLNDAMRTGAEDED